MVLCFVSCKISVCYFFSVSVCMCVAVYDLLNVFLFYSVGMWYLLYIYCCVHSVYRTIVVCMIFTVQCFCVYVVCTVQLLYVCGIYSKIVACMAFTVQLLCVYVVFAVQLLCVWYSPYNYCVWYLP